MQKIQTVPLFTVLHRKSKVPRPEKKKVDENHKAEIKWMITDKKGKFRSPCSQVSNAKVLIEVPATGECTDQHKQNQK